MTQLSFLAPTAQGEQVLPLGAAYPLAVASRPVDTSQAAAEAMAPRVETLRAKVYGALTRRSQTADEVAESLGESILAIRPRVTELHKAGYLLDTGERRANASGRLAVVWRAV